RDLDTVDKKLAKDKKLAAMPASPDAKEAKARVGILERIKESLDAGKPARLANLAEDEELLVRDLGLLTLKPMFYCANMREDEINTGNAHLEAVKAFAASQHCDVVVISGKIESEIAELDAEEKE